ncbi:8179_t:CDS:2, partial [Racocetra persica]
FTNEYRIKRRNNGHKQYGFVSTFLYNKRMNKFIFELRGQGNEIQLKINKEDIEKVFDAPDRFDIEHVVKLEKWDMITEVLEETGLDIKKISCEIKYFG